MHIHQFFHMPLFDDEDCDAVTRVANKDALTKGKVLGGSTGIKEKLTRNCALKWLDPDAHTKWMFEKIGSAVQKMNNDTLKFNLDGGMEKLQYLEYGFGQFYAVHTDNSDDKVATRKLTAIIQLSDPKDYWGGTLKIEGTCLGQPGKGMNSAPKKRGTIILFPSHLRHIAMPVFVGKRRALVAWFHGTQPLR